MDETYKIAVIGGRIASLACAMSLAEAGVNVDIYSPRPIERYVPTGSGGINTEDNPEAPEIISLLDRLGVPFDREPDGKIRFTLTGQSSLPRTATAGDETGRHIHRVLCDQVRRWEKAGRIFRRGDREIVDFILDESGACIGLISLDLKSMEISAEGYDAVVVAVNGPLSVFGECAGINDDFGPMLIAYKSGVKWANPHMFIWEDDLEPLVIENQENDVPDAEPVGTPSINIRQPFAVRHLGGLRVDDKYRTDIPRLYATGECAYLGEGDGILPGNELLTDIYAGLSCADSIKEYIEAGIGPQGELDRDEAESRARQATEKFHNLLKKSGDEDEQVSSKSSPRMFHHLLAATMRRCAGPWRNSGTLEEADIIFKEILLPECSSIRPFDTNPYANRDFPMVHRMTLLIPACEAIIKAASIASAEGQEPTHITAEWSIDGPIITSS